MTSSQRDHGAVGANGATGASDAAALRAELLRRRLAGKSAARPGGRAKAASGIPRVRRDGPLALSSGQRQFWFLHQLAPEAPEYLLPMAYRLSGPVDAAALREAFGQLAERHEILRTRYVLEGGEPRQVIDPPGPADFLTEHRTGLAPQEREKQAAHCLKDAALRPLDLAAQPPMRVRLTRFADDDHLLVVVLHHIVCDGATRHLLLAELSELYAARTERRAPRLPADPVQFADYAAWLTEQQAGPEVREAHDWWRGQLAGLAPLDLPTDRPRGAVRSWAGDTERFTVPQPVAARLRELALESGASLFMVTLTAFQALLARHTGVRDIAVGTAVSARTRPELATMAGYAFNTLVMRARWEGDPSFRELLAANRDTVLASLDHAAAPFDRIAESLELTRDLSTTPVYQVMFDLAEAAGADPLRLPGAAAHAVDVPAPIARFDLTVHLEERPDGGIDGALEYATALFDATTARRLTGQYVRLLDTASATPAEPVAALDIFDAEERTLLVDGRPDPVGTRAPLDATALHPVHETIARQAAATPDAVAVHHGDRSVTYRELDEHACRTGHLLREHGVGPERTVAVLLDSCPETLATLLGIWRAGGAYVPLDPGYPDDRLAYMVADTGSRLVITERRYAQRLAHLDVTLLVVDTPEGRAAVRRSASGPLDPPPGGYDLDHLAYVIYTSGSTGRPKGVLVPHRGLANYLGWTVDAYASAGTGGAPFFSSLAFDLGVPDLYTPLMTGQPVHLLSQDADITALGQLLALRAPYAFVKLTPGHLDLLTQQLTDEQAASLAGVVIAAGDAFTGRLANRWLRKAGPGGTRLAAEYGPTEITVGNSAYFLDGPQDAELVSIGRAIPHTTMRVLDEGLRPVPIGGIGEVYVSGIGLARGYAGRPGQTAERFLPDPFGAPGRRLYRTGDLARVLPDGNLDFVSRADHQVKLRGYRIEPGEIETALTSVPGVAEAVALVREDTPGDRRLVAYLVPDAAGETADGVLPVAPEQLRAHLETALPDYMIPSAFVTLPALPLTANGKLDRAALPVPGREAAAVGDHVAPRTEEERSMAAVWCGVLGLDRVGVRDDFFDLGGDSMRAVALAGALREQGQPVAVRDIFEHRTVADLCRVIGQGGGGGGEVFTPVEPFALITEQDRAALPADAVDAYPLSRTQAGMFIEMYADAEHRYHNITSFRIRDDKPFDPAAFQRAADLVVARHEVMRTSFVFTGYSRALQIVHANGTMPCHHEDLRHLPEDLRWPTLTAYADADRMRLLDAARAPLMRMATHVLDDEGWWLSITEGHPAIEGWSYHNQLMEMLRAYERYRDGHEADPAPEPPVLRYADFIAAELRSLEAGEDRDFWRALVDAHEKFRVPRGWAADDWTPDAGDGEGTGVPERYRIDIPLGDLEPGLRALATGAEVPYKSVLHAAHSKVLGLLTRQESFRGGMVIDARPEVRGADRVSGMYLNSVPFPYRRGAATWGELAREVFDAEVQVWPHRRFPMPAMRREGGDRHLVDVLFHYLDFYQVDGDLVDSAVSRDISPNEFPLVVGTPTRGLLSLASDVRTLRRDRAERLARLYRAVLEDMAATGPHGDALRGYPEATERGVDVQVIADDYGLPCVPRLPGSDGPFDALAAFEEQARRTPDAPAVVAGAARLTYAELDAGADRLAARLARLGAGGETRVGVLLDRGPALVVALLAIWKAGGAYVPVDPCTPETRLRALFGDAGCRLVVTDSGYAPRIAVTLDVLCVDAPEESAPEESAPERADSAPRPARFTDPDRLAYVLHTSGSTGRPKGVEVSHRALGHYLDWAVHHYLDGRDEFGRPVGGAPFFTSIGADLGVPALFGPLLTGRTVTLLPQRWEPAELGALLSAGAPYSFVGLTPGHLALLEEQLDGKELAALAPLLVTAGEALPAGQAERVAARVADSGGTLRLVAEYGPTEATVAASAYRTNGTVVRDLVPMGLALPGTTLRILDENLFPVPDGAVGEVYIGGDGLARGYARQPGHTAECFLPDPYGPPGGRLYRTGDLARVLPGGEMEFAGRLGRQLNVRGHRVEPAEIEAALLTDPRVREALVVPVPRDIGGSTATVWVVPADGAARLTGAALRGRLRDLLPEPLVPATYRIVAELPLTENGKYDRRAMARIGVEHARPRSTDTFTAPRTRTERTIAEVWQKVLGLAWVGVHDRFTDLGGDSLLSLSVLAGCRSAGLELDLSTILRNPTVAALAVAHDTAVPHGTAAAPAGARDTVAAHARTAAHDTGKEG